MQTKSGVKVKRNEKLWEVEIAGTIPAETIARFRVEVIKDLKKTVKVDGFRPGMAPEAMIISQVGEEAILRQAAEDAVRDELPEILAKEQVNIVDAPRVAIEPPKAGEPLSFTAHAPLAPEITLPDYANIGSKHAGTKEPVEVSDEEHADTLTHLKRERARIERMETGMAHEKALEEVRALKPEELPELDDEFVKGLGYESAAAFSDAVRSNIKNEKELQATEKHRAAMLTDLVKAATVRYPAMLAEYELDDMEARLSGDLERSGTTLENYLAETKKTREALRQEWKDAADTRAKTRLVLAEIARKEGIEPSPEAVAHEVGHAMEQYPKADRNTVQAHIAHAMKNDMVIRFLETGDKTPPPPHEH